MNKIIPFLALAVCLPACTPVGLLTGAAATTGVAAAKEGGIRSAVTDAGIQAAINDLWLKYDLETFAKLDLTVDQGRVLVTGVVQNPEHRVEAIRLAWQPKGVKQVINEVRVAKSTGIVGYARDSWISARLRTAITFDKNIQSINYSIDTVQGTVYLMGVAQNQDELNRVMQTARTIPDVKQVISYTKFAGEEVSAQSQPAQSTGAGDSRGGYDSSVSSSPPPATDTSGPIGLLPVEAEPL